MKYLKKLNTAAFAVMIIVNVLANVLRFGGNTTGQVSGKWPSLFTPAAYAFSIWSVIYALMAAFILYQWEFFDPHKRGRECRESIGIWFVFSCVLNAAWIVSWHMEMLSLSLVLIVLLLMNLFIIEDLIPERTSEPLLGRLTRVGFELYTGWIAAASIANADVLLSKAGITTLGIPAEFCAIVALILGTTIGIIMILLEKKWIAGLAIIWAFVGILVRHVSAGGYAGMYRSVIVIDIIGILALLACIVSVLMGKSMREHAIACQNPKV